METRTVETVDMQNTSRTIAVLCCRELCLFSGNEIKILMWLSGIGTSDTIYADTLVSNWFMYDGLAFVLIAFEMCLTEHYLSFYFNLQQAACSSYQNTIGRHSTIGPYSHLSTKYPYHVSNSNTNSNNDFSHTSQYGYNSWGMWRDSRNLTPSSTYSSKSRRTSIKSFTIILMTAAFIVVLAVLSVAALAFYFSTFKSDDCKHLTLNASAKH